MELKRKTATPRQRRFSYALADGRSSPLAICSSLLQDPDVKYPTAIAIAGEIAEAAGKIQPIVETKLRLYLGRPRGRTSKQPVTLIARIERLRGSKAWYTHLKQLLSQVSTAVTPGTTPVRGRFECILG